MFDRILYLCVQELEPTAGKTSRANVSLIDYLCGYKKKKKKKKHPKDVFWKKYLKVILKMVIFQHHGLTVGQVYKLLHRTSNLIMKNFLLSVRQEINFITSQ